MLSHRNRVDVADDRQPNPPCIKRLKVNRVIAHAVSRHHFQLLCFRNSCGRQRLGSDDQSISFGDQVLVGSLRHLLNIIDFNPTALIIFEERYTRGMEFSCN
ncbi:hypothetical protein D3C76_1031120 [compost metagenome]